MPWRGKGRIARTLTRAGAPWAGAGEVDHYTLSCTLAVYRLADEGAVSQEPRIHDYGQLPAALRHPECTSLWGTRIPIPVAW